MGLNDTPRSNRIHIGIFGRTNSGKSSLINALTGQEAALVSDQEGTTTDPVFKTMEIHGIGPCVFIDTAGFDDTGALGELRQKATKETLKKTDIALIVFTAPPSDSERAWLCQLLEEKIPVIPVLNKCDIFANPASDVCHKISDIQMDVSPKLLPLLKPVAAVSARTGQGIDNLRKAIVQALPPDMGNESITGSLVSSGDVVLLVMPQDIQAPKGRLILPQVQTIRELLDKKCSVVSCTADTFSQTLKTLKETPSLIITDSQVFKSVYEKKPKESSLTSFSVLFAAYKGDAAYLKESTNAIRRLTPSSRVLIAEACTHAPLTEDIGREKIPALLRKKIGQELTIDMVAGQDFPRDLSGYDLIIHCGACMFNKKYVLSRVEEAKAYKVPMTNYGMAIASLQGILDKIDIPD